MRALFLACALVALCGCGKKPLPHLYAVYGYGDSRPDTVLGWYSADRGNGPGAWVGGKCVWAAYAPDSVVWLPRRIKLYQAAPTPSQESLNRAAINAALERDR